MACVLPREVVASLRMSGRDLLPTIERRRWSLQTCGPLSIWSGGLRKWWQVWTFPEPFSKNQDSTHLYCSKYCRKEWRLTEYESCWFDMTVFNPYSWFAFCSPLPSCLSGTRNILSLAAEGCDSAPRCQALFASTADSEVHLAGWTPTKPSLKLQQP